MHNNLLHVSATALQKQLEKEAQVGNYVDQGNLEQDSEEERSSSILSRLSDWLHRTEKTQPHTVAPKLKNKIV